MNSIKFEFAIQSEKIFYGFISIRNNFICFSFMYERFLMVFKEIIQLFSYKFRE